MMLLPPPLFAQDTEHKTATPGLQYSTETSPLDLSCFSETDSTGRTIYIVELIKKFNQKKKEMLTFKLGGTDKEMKHKRIKKKKPASVKTIRVKVSLDGGSISTGINFEIER